MYDTTLEEFLEELDALAEADVENQRNQDSKTSRTTPDPDGSSTSEAVAGGPVAAAALTETTSVQGKVDASPPRASEKKVRFSEELIQGAHRRQIPAPQDAVSSLSSSQQNQTKHEVQGPPRERGVWHRSSETERAKRDPLPPSPADKACASLQESSVRSVELTKCNAGTSPAPLTRPPGPVG